MANSFQYFIPLLRNLKTLKRSLKTLKPSTLTLYKTIALYQLTLCSLNFSSFPIR